MICRSLTQSPLSTDELYRLREMETVFTRYKMLSRSQMITKVSTKSSSNIICIILTLFKNELRPE